MLAEKGSSLLNKPICQNLCTKALYTPGGNLQNLVETNPFSNYWCNCTMTVVGPDDRFVSPENCFASSRLGAPLLCSWIQGD